MFGFFQVIHNTAATAMLLENVPNEMRGRVMGIFNFGRLGLRVMNGPFFTLLNKVALLGVSGAFAINAITLTAAAATVAVLTLTMFWITPGVRRQQ